MPRKPGQWKVLQPFSFKDGAQVVRCERGSVVPPAVLEQAVLRMRLLRTKYIVDADHPESFGGAGLTPGRLERLERDLDKPLRPAEQDTPVAPAVLAARRAAAELRIQEANHRQGSVYRPEKSEPDRMNPAGSYPVARAGG